MTAAWFMAGVLLAAILSFVAILTYAKRKARATAHLAEAIASQLADLRSMGTAEAAERAARVVAEQAERLPWNGSIPADVDAQLARLPRETATLLRAQQKLLFAGAAIQIGADFLLPADGPTSVPADYSPIGRMSDDDLVICASRRTLEVKTLNSADGTVEEAFQSIHHFIAIAADVELGKR